MAGYPHVAAWRPAHPNNFAEANRPYSDPVKLIVVHVTQGSWSSALNWFQDPYAGVSAHYTVRSRDGRVGQSVSELNVAYHAGSYRHNGVSVGIEHEGYVDDPSWFTHEMYRSSAALAAYLCDEYGIPVDRDHIVGHNEVPGATHTDPGDWWYWDLYMSYVHEYAGASAHQ